MEFHDAIAASIPTIVAQLKSMKYQSNVVHTLSKLAERGRCLSCGLDAFTDPATSRIS